MDIKAFLDSVWQVMEEDAGVTDSIQIAEHLGYMLIKMYGDSPLINASILRRSYRMAGLTGARAEMLERELGTAVDSLVGRHDLMQQPPERHFGVHLSAVLFDRFILPRVRMRAEGAQYPTPRHIAAAMAASTAPRVGDVVLDPACGTGGLLARFNAATVYGFDRSEPMLALAELNAALHGARNAVFSERDGLKVEQRADVVLMDPPRRKDGTQPSRLELGLVRNAWDLTKQRAAMLVSTELLGSRRNEVMALKMDWQRSVSAVVTLPRHAMQPYDDQTAHMVLLNRQNESEFVWMLVLDRDGYRGASRDVSVPPRLENQLELIPHLTDVREKQASGRFIIVSTDTDGPALGLFVYPAADEYVSEIYNWQRRSERAVVFKLANTSDAPPQYFAMTQSQVSDGAPTMDEAIAQLWPDREGVTAGLQLDVETAPGMPVLISAAGRLLGAAFHRRELGRVDWRPVAWLKSQTSQPEPEPPPVLIQRIQEKHEALTGLLEELALALAQPVRGVSAPVAPPTWPEPLVPLSDAQLAVLTRVREQRDLAGRAVYFVPKSVMADGQSVQQTEQTIELLRRLGLVAHVVIDGQSLFRFTAQAELQAEIPSGEEE